MPASLLRHELAAAVRSLLRAPGFTAIAFAMLTLGIGANVALFSVFHSIVLSPLPYADAHRLVGIGSLNTSKALAQPALSAADFRDLHASAENFSALAAFRPDFSAYTPSGGEPVQVVSALVTEDFFGVFGLAPLRGRTFRADEYGAAAPRTAVISAAFWRRQFGERDDLVGTTVLLDQQPTTIIGIMPDGFREPEFVDLWLPFDPQSPENLARDSRYWETVGKLKPGVTLAHARAEAATLAAGLAREYPAMNRGWTFAVAPLLEQRTGPVRHSLLLLVGAVGLVLLVACVNLANLLLARGLVRQPQLAVRLALGATPASLARGVVFESTLLGLAGGVAGIALAAAALSSVPRYLPAGLIPRSHAIGLDGSALAFALVLSLLTGLVFGLLPAWQVGRTNVNELLKSAGARGTSSRFIRRLQAALVVSQVALTLTVLTSAALLVQGLLRLQRTHPGFDPHHVLAVRISAGIDAWQDPVALAHYYDRLLTELQRTPGVTAAAINSSAPLAGITLRYPFWVQGRPRTEGNTDEAVFSSVSPDFLNTLQLPLVRGRFIDARDDDASPLVCVVNEAFVRRVFPDQNPLGQRVQTVPWLGAGYREIVGVVADTRQDNLADPPPPQLYVPSPQSPWFFTTILVRVSPAATAATVQTALRRADPMLPMQISSLDDAIALTSLQPRLRAWLFGLFGLSALALSGFGIYASLAFTVSQRIREIGVRMALGAAPPQILRWVLGRAARLTACGALAGVFGAVAAAQLLRGFIPDLPRIDFTTLGALTLFLAVVALVASAHPAWRAARLNPTHALQQD